jgi:outer membrane protein TolC
MAAATAAAVALLASAAQAQDSGPSEAQGSSKGPGDEPKPLPLAELTRLAAESYPSLRAARHAIDAAQAKLDEAKVSPFFQFEATAGATIAPSASGTPIYSQDSQLPLSNEWRPIFRVGVEGALPLYTFGKLRGAWHAAEAGVRAAEERPDQARAELERNVRRAYFALQMALDLQQMIREGRGKLDQAIDQLDKRLEQDDTGVDPMDRYRLQAASAEVDARGSEATRLERSSRAALRTLTGLGEVRVPVCPIEPVSVELRPARHYVDLAADHRPELVRLQAAIRARQAQVQVQRGQYYPDLALAMRASYSYGPGITDQENPFIQDNANFQSLGAGLVARWSLDFWGNVHRVRRAEAQLAELRAKADEARRGVRLEVQTTYEKAKDARRRERAWDRGEQKTRQWFVAAAQAYQIGTLEPKELIDAIKTYFTNRFEHLKAIRDFNTAIAELERVTGSNLIPAGQWEDCEPR